jgi:hypothetical protein
MNDEKVALSLQLPGNVGFGTRVSLSRITLIPSPSPEIKDRFVEGGRISSHGLPLTRTKPIIV